MLVKNGEQQFNSLWLALIRTAVNVPPFYSELTKNFQQQYHKSIEFTDISFLVCQQSIPILGIVGAIAHLQPDYCELSNYRNPLLILLNPSYAKSDGNHTEKLLLKEVKRVIEKFNVKNIYFRDLLYQGRSSQLTHFLLQQGAIATPRFTSILDLTYPLTALHHNLRRSYKNLINWGLDHLELQVYHHQNIGWAEIAACRDLHIAAAGRVTRNLTTWQIQHQMILNQEAFLVMGHLDQELVTFGLFIYSPHYCYYGVSASKRELFDQPLFHAVMWTGITHAKNLGCHWFETGDIVYEKQHQVSQKEVDIGFFKKGFGGEVRVHLDLRWSAP